MRDSQRLIGIYEEYLAVDLRLSPLTVEAYLREIIMLEALLNQAGTDLAGADSADLVDFIEHRRDQGLEKATVSRIITTLRSFYGFLVDEQVRSDDPSRIIEMPRKGRQLPGVLQVREVEEVLEAIPLDTPEGLRDRALFELIYSCGLRISEACGMRTSQVYSGESLLRIIGKRDRERVVPMGRQANASLERYMQEGRPRLLSSRHAHEMIFVSRGGNPLTRQGAWKKFRLYCAAAGVSSQVHTLRHSFATHMLQGGADLRVVQELLGHRDISTTQIYTHVTAAELQDGHRKFHPGSRMDQTSIDTARSRSTLRYERRAAHPHDHIDEERAAL